MTKWILTKQIWLWIIMILAAIKVMKSIALKSIIAKSIAKPTIAQSMEEAVAAAAAAAVAAAMAMLVIISLFSCLSFSSIASAKDFGILGHTYQISEGDILKEIEARLSKIDMEQLNKKMAASTRSYATRPPKVRNITVAKEAKEYLYDPTYTLKENIIDQNGHIIHLAGTKVNPLSHVPLREALIFIDGDDASQVDLALKIKAQRQQKLKIILVKGSPLELQRKYKIWIYFDQAGVITTKLDIQEIPALVAQDGMQLKINIIAGAKLKEARNIGNLNIKREKSNAKTLS